MKQKTGFFFSETALVDFGNYILEKYNVKVYSNEGLNMPLYQRNISDADISNWRIEYLNLDND